MILFLFIFFTFSTLVANENFQQAQSLYNSGKYYDAKDTYELISEDQGNVDIYYLGFQIYYILDDLKLAGPLLYKAKGADEARFEEEYNLFRDFYDRISSVNISVDQGNFDDAISEYESLLNDYPENAIVYSRTGDVYKKKKDYDSAISMFEKALSAKPYVKLYAQQIRSLAEMQAKLGQDEFRRQDYQAAMEFYNKAIEYDSSYAAPIFGLGNVYYNIKDFDKAIEYYVEGLKYSDLSSHKHRKLYQLGVFYTKVNNNEKAIESFDKSLEQRPGYTKAMFEKAKIFRSTGDIDAARLLLTQCIDIDPAYSKPYEELMDMEIDSKNYDEAIMHGERCLEFNPAAYTVKMRFAKLYNDSKNYKEAKKYAKQAIADNRKYSAAYYELGIAEKFSCNKVAAKDAFKKAKTDRNFRKAASVEIKQLDQWSEKNCD